MTILATDLNRADATFKVAGSSLLIYGPDSRFKNMGRVDEEVRFRDGIYRLDGEKLVSLAGDPAADLSVEIAALRAAHIALGEAIDALERKVS